ncbi:MAG: alanine:cation symporter family protein [Eisenbergiella sp.]
MWFSPILSASPFIRFRNQSADCGYYSGRGGWIYFPGSIRRIARFTEKIVPLMAVLYITGCVIVLVMTGSE